jgi:NAD(P)H-hydrate epimerase
MTRPEIMAHAVEDANELLPLLDKASVVVVGPGLGQDPWAQALLSQIVTLNKPSVWDADALNWLAAHPHKLNCSIATPHPGEAARLLQCTTADIATDRFAAVQALQSAFGGVWLLKGAGSLITDGNSIGVSTTGNPGMASGGMGDVLAGICGSLLAQGLSLLEACQLAVYIHGEAADLCAAQAGERGMLASDLIAKLRQCLN